MIYQCPTCQTKYSGNSVCHRCQTDLSQLIELIQMAKDHIQESENALLENNIENMFFHAKRAYHIIQTHETAKHLAYAAFLKKDFTFATSLFTQQQLDVTE
ncbi:MAG: hypothetical protein HQK77_10995 [Desulfobacterales bacterium]|nr:hypothetical protein [Desulfobacterales bacterium]